MGTEVFFVLFENHIFTYFVCLFLSVILHLYLIKKYTNGITDPLFYNLIMTILANTIPIFLYWTGNISSNAFIYILIAEFMYWTGFILFTKHSFSFNGKILVDNHKAMDYIFFLFLSIYIVFKIIIYTTVGIPAFMGSRLEMYREAVGLGVFERLISFPIFYVITYSFYLIDKKKFLFWAYFAFIVHVIFSLLSGSKSTVLLLVFGYFTYTYIYKGKIVTLKSIAKYIPFLIMMPIINLILQSAALGWSEGFARLLMRFVANGDVYYMSFPNNNIEYVKIKNKFTYYFSNIMWPLRLVDLKDLDTVVGFQLTWIVYPSIYGAGFGPNTRNPVLGWVLYHWGGVIFCFIQGLITSFLMFRPVSILPKSLLTCIYAGYVYNLMLGFVTDSGLGMSSIFDVFLNTIILIVVYLFFNGPTIKLISRKNS